MAIDVLSRPMMTRSSMSVNIDPVNTIATIAASCPPLLQEPLEAEDAEQLASALKVIADPARVRLLSLIQAQPAHEACVCHLTEPLGLSQPTVSHHLKVLLEAGLVERDKRGSWAYYRVLPGPLAALREVLGGPDPAATRAA
jgi:ArsR family transcriptional regulator, arsenate/arsenite/antimonite-responsive transcriptional repressor